ncbi:hypothetical protein [Mucilaginibacter terrae]|uniref:Lipocalin-like domain-containing protein n=1 Tax=Mucilaginibacter terrae TaxID=1955052 RepID=A0ABU3GY95_9SPHI|nr:hypothetical protein [Mucilaginibacter terrae]MDT3404749.1 hypothetical protein [Mucilaginibacter terrae]
MTKKIYVFLVFALAILSSSCKQDPPILPANLQNAQLIGKWQLEEMLPVTEIDGIAQPNTIPYTGTTNDYFIFDTGNRAILSSTIYQKAFQGYYSSNSAASTLSFKSGEFLVRYNVEGISINQLQLSELVSSTTDATTGSVTTITNIYTYSRLP